MARASKSKYDVIIVGGGPAGIFAALELSKKSNLDILLLEKGRDVDRRRCPIIGKDISCLPCKPCGLVSGFGGAGAFSDGKLTLTPDVGGRLKEYVGAERTKELIRQVDNVYLEFGASNHIFGVGEDVDVWQSRASLAELSLIPVPLRHIGTERSRRVMAEIRDDLSDKVEILTSTPVATDLAKDGQVCGVRTKGEQEIAARYVIVGPGREGADWMVNEAKRLKLTMHNNPVDVGVRVEVPAAVMEGLTDVLYEGKLEFYSKSFDDRIRTFCMCPHGEVTMESTAGDEPVTTVNGHSYAGHKTKNTNFALLVSTSFTEPFREPMAYGRYLARLANIISGSVLVQRLGDLLEGRRSTTARIERGVVSPTLRSATPGDLSFALPYRYLKGIIEMLEAMDRLLPGVASRHTLLYGVEVKFYSARLELTQQLETEVENLFAAGDGAGVTRGLIQASASGVVAAQAVLQRIGGKVAAGTV
jgi:hypothetical protein